MTKSTKKSSVKSKKVGSVSDQSQRETRKRLLKVGLTQLKKEGIKGLSIRKVASLAKVNLGSFVYHFKTKDLFVEEIMQEIYKELLRILDESVGDSEIQNPMKRLRKLIATLLNAVVEYDDLVFRTLLDVLQGDELIVKIASRNPPPHVKYLLGVVAECQKAGQIRNDVDPQMVLILFASNVGAPLLIARQLRKKAKVPAFKKLLDRMVDAEFTQIRVDLLLAGLEVRER